MSFLNNWYNKEPKKEIFKDSPPLQGMSLFFSVLWREFLELCKLNLIIIIFCLPIVTIPATLTAVAKVLVLMFMDQPTYTFGDFWLTFKKEGIRATLVGLGYFMLLAISIFTMYFYYQIAGNFVLYTIAMLVGAIILIMGFYLFPLLSVVELNIKGVIKNAFLLTLLRMPKNILALLSIVLLTAVVILFLPPTLITMLLLYFVLLNYITVFCAYEGLRKYIIIDEKTE